MVKNFFIAFLLLILLPIFCFGQRRLELDYPEVPGAIKPVYTVSALPETLVYFFNLAIILSGLIVFGVLIYGGIRYLTSMGDFEAQKEAKSRIGSGFLGVILLLGSYILLRTINPQIIIPTVGREYPVQGIVLYKVENCGVGKFDEENFGELKKDGKAIRLKTSVANLRFFLGEDYTDKIESIYFFESFEDLEVKFFDRENYQPDGIVALRQRAGDCLPADVFPPRPRSIQITPKPPGVYLCTNVYDQDGICHGIEKHLGVSVSVLPEEFNDKVYGLKIKPEKEYMGECPNIECILSYERVCQNEGGWGVKTATKDGITKVYCLYTYGVILHEHGHFSKTVPGRCEVFLEPGIIPDLTETELDQINAGTSSVTVFRPVKEVAAIGNGVRFSDTEDWGGPWYPDPDKEESPYRYEEVKNAKKEKGIPDSTITSLTIEGTGDYIAILFDGEDYKDRCEAFIASDPTLRDNPLGRCKGWPYHDCLSSFKVYPLKIGTGGTVMPFEEIPPTPPAPVCAEEGEKLCINCEKGFRCCSPQYKECVQEKWVVKTCRVPPCCSIQGISVCCKEDVDCSGECRMGLCP